MYSIVSQAYFYRLYLQEAHICAKCALVFMHSFHQSHGHCDHSAQEVAAAGCFDHMDDELTYIFLAFDDQSISNILDFHQTKLTDLGQLVEGANIFLCQFVMLLRSEVKTSPFVDNVHFWYEVGV